MTLGPCCMQMDLEQYYQNRAFMNLDEKQKKAMLINAKLKDEGDNPPLFLLYCLSNV